MATTRLLSFAPVATPTTGDFIYTSQAGLEKKLTLAQLTAFLVGTYVQEQDADLDAIAALTGIGLARRTGPGTWTLDASNYATLTGAERLTNKVVDYAPTVVIASAASVDIGASASNSIAITGTTAITSLGTIGAGVERNTTFTDALTLTHNATALILPGAANIITAAGDVAYWVSLGAGNWRCTGYTKANGQPVIVTAANPVLPITVVTANTTAVAGNHYVIATPGVTLTLPATPTKDDCIEITNASLSSSTVTVDFGSVKLRTQTPGAMTLVDVNFKCRIQYSGNSTYGWA